MNSGTDFAGDDVGTSSSRGNEQIIETGARSLSE
jgi:hypothetical protein